MSSGMLPCHLVKSYKQFNRPECLHWHNIAEDRSLHQQHCENLKSHIAHTLFILSAFSNIACASFSTSVSICNTAVAPISDGPSLFVVRFDLYETITSSSSLLPLPVSSAVVLLAVFVYRKGQSMHTIFRGVFLQRSSN